MYEDKKDKELVYYSPEEAYKIMVLRYAISQNSFQKYVQTTIAQNVREVGNLSSVANNMGKILAVDILSYGVFGDIYSLQYIRIRRI